MGEFTMPIADFEKYINDKAKVALDKDIVEGEKSEWDGWVPGSYINGGRIRCSGCDKNLFDPKDRDLGVCRECYWTCPRCAEIGPEPKGDYICDTCRYG